MDLGRLLGACEGALRCRVQLRRALQRRLDEWEQESERNREEERRRRKQQQQFRQQQQQQQQQRRQSSHNANWDWEYQRQNQQQAWEQWERQSRQQDRHQHQQRARQPRAHPQPSHVDLLRDRALRLPAGDMRRSALLAATHYEALGITRDASAAEAKKAFHKLALRLHPDKNKQPLAEEAFKRVEEAHRTLSDRRLRAEYDLTLPSRHGARTYQYQAHGASSATRRKAPYRWE